MRTISIALMTFGLALTFTACGDDGNAKDMAAPDLAVQVDLLPARDLAMPDFAGVACGAMTCGTGNDCCVRPTGTGIQQMCVPTGTCSTDGGAAVMCDGPEDCSSDAPPNGGCCIALSGQASADAGVTGGGGSSMCEMNCIGSVVLDGSGNATANSKLCHVKADCVGYNGSVLAQKGIKFDGCCTSPMFGTVHFCAPTAFASQAGLTCD